MVEDFLETGGYQRGQLVDHILLQNPESDVKTHREFRMKLADQLVQPLLDLWASVDCPQTSV